MQYRFLPEGPFIHGRSPKKEEHIMADYIRFSVEAHFRSNKTCDIYHSQAWCSDLLLLSNNGYTTV